MAKAKRLRIFYTVVILLVATVISRGAAQAASGAATPATRLNEAQAVQVARAFCLKIGQAVTSPATVVSPSTNGEAAIIYWQPCWQVNFSGQAEMQIADATSVVAEYRNQAYHILHRDRTPAGESLPQQEAILRAKEAVDATGQREPLLFWQASLDHYSDPPLAETSIWSVRWRRASGGVPYRNQHTSVSLDAQTGEVEGVVLMFGTAPLAGAARVLRQEDATNTAATLIVSQGVEQTATHSDTSLEIITPDYDWNKLHGRPGPANDVRLAWVSTLVVDGHWREVYLDTETGEVLGGGRDNGPAGMHTAAAPVAAPVPPPIAPMLRAVCAVYVRGKNADGKWVAKPLLKFGTKDQPHALALLRKTADFRKGGPTGVAPHQIVLARKSNVVGVYSYFPETGLLGGGSDWAIVSDEFKTWMLHKIASADSSPVPAPHR